MIRFSRFLVMAMLLAAPLAAQHGGPPAPKDMGDVTKLYLAPFTTDDPQNATFRAALKTRLVNEGFIVFEKPENTDATLIVEITSGREGNLAKFEFHAFLDAGLDNQARWNRSAEKTGPDLAKLMDTASRNIASGLHDYRSEVRTKKRDENEKKKQ